MKIHAILFLVASLASCTSQATNIPPAYHKIAEHYHIPVEVFYAVMLQESGRTNEHRYLPWPWVLNVELRAYYFDTKESATIALRQFLAINEKARIAVGLGQIYLPSHGHLFADKTELLDPAVNLNYSAQLLADSFAWTLTQGKPNWWVAVGRYHTPSNADLAKNYREDVFQRCKRLSEFCSRYGAI